MKKKVANLYLDYDINRKAPFGFIHAVSVNQALYILKTYDIDSLSIQYDMGRDLDGYSNPSGYMLIKWMQKENLKCKSIFIHETNRAHHEKLYEAITERLPGIKVYSDMINKGV